MNHQQQNSVRKVVQQSCSSRLSRAAGGFGQISALGEIPIVLCPRRRGLLGGPLITIPTGVTAIIASNGGDMGEVPPGTFFAPPWVRVLYMVPNQACTYNYDIMACPTNDNVMVEVDVTLVFRITAARDFCFKLGAQKFDEMLKAVCEEAIRSMVRKISHKVVYELRGSGADELLNVVNKKFENFGVIFVNTTITNVLLPQDVAQALQRITQLTQQMKEHVKSHEFEMNRLNDQHALSLQELTLEQDRIKAELKAEKKRLKIDLTARQIEMEKQKELAIIKANEVRSVGMKEMNAKLTNERIRAETEKEMLIQQAQTQAKKQLLEAQHWGENQTISSEAELISAQNRAKVILLEGEAEKHAAKCLKQSREHKLKLQFAETLNRLASSNKLIISGKDGQKLISEMTGSSSYVESLLARS